MDELIRTKIDNKEHKIFIEKVDDTIIIDNNKFIDDKPTGQLLIDLAIRYEHHINDGYNIILNGNVINTIPNRRQIWDSYSNEDKKICPCCEYNYITIFTFHVRYKMKDSLYLETLIPLCNMCYTKLGDKPYESFKKEYDERYLRINTKKCGCKIVVGGVSI